MLEPSGGRPVRNIRGQIRQRFCHAIAGSKWWRLQVTAAVGNEAGRGLAIASLVLIPNLPDNPTLRNLPPLAIALVAGYSVDLIFSFLDRVIHAFKPETAVRPTPPPA